MSEDARGERLLVLDACCLINLFATDRAADFLAALPYRCGVPRFVAEREVLRIFPSSDAPEEEDRRIAMAEIEALEGLSILDLEGAFETAQWVRFATVLDDGEAAACALAVGRGGLVATDDRKALSVLARWAPDIAVVQTSEIVFAAATHHRWSAVEVRAVVRQIRDRARFIPRRGAPQGDAWLQLLSEEEGP